MVKNHLRKATSVIRKNTWYDAIITRNASGLTIRDWCRENGVNETSYYYWLKKIRSEALEAQDTEKVPRVPGNKKAENRKRGKHN